MTDKTEPRQRRAPRPSTGRRVDARLAQKGEELAAAQAMLDRYETALRGLGVTVFAQDEKLRYTALSNGMFGKSVDDIIGQDDETVLPAENREQLIALKRGVLASGQSITQEISFGHDGTAYWYEFHLEPVWNAERQIVGLAAAAVDVTARKVADGHLRLLMRELTHRSKNLLAVIQAMARQTAKHTRSVDDFLGQFGERLQALATSHDLLVEQSWRGVLLEDLMRSQLGPYLRGPHARVTLDGPEVIVRPEAAQSLGLALHEMGANAAKYGALSVPEGRVAIEWSVLPVDGVAGLDLHWRESGGPPVQRPQRAGFGTLVIERNLTQALGARVAVSYGPEGFRCDIHIPASSNLATR